METTTMQLLQENQKLTEQMSRLNDTVYSLRMHFGNRSRSGMVVGDDDDNSIVTIRQPLPPVRDRTSLAMSPFLFETEQVLLSSRVYRNATRESCDYSFASSDFRSGAWSAYSGLTLANISIISVLALPLFIDDIHNHEHYTFDTDAPETPILAQPATATLHDGTLFPPSQHPVDQHTVNVFQEPEDLHEIFATWTVAMLSMQTEFPESKDSDTSTSPTSVPTGMVISTAVTWQCCGCSKPGENMNNLELGKRCGPSTKRRV